MAEKSNYKKRKKTWRDIGNPKARRKAKAKAEAAEKPKATPPKATPKKDEKPKATKKVVAPEKARFDDEVVKESKKKDKGDVSGRVGRKVSRGGRKPPVKKRSK